MLSLLLILEIFINGEIIFDGHIELRLPQLLNRLMLADIDLEITIIEKFSLLETIGIARLTVIFGDVRSGSDRFELDVL